MSGQNRRRTSDRLGERVEFRFSNLRAVQVPVVSDRLLLSIISVDTGKTIAKSSKAAARNGICQWPDSILESIWFSQDEESKEFQDCQCKIVVSMGSTKTGILGEIFLNLTNYLSSQDLTAISLPLKKCNSGTVLQLKIQCLGTKSNSSAMKQSSTNDEMGSKSDSSDRMDGKSARSSSGNHLGGVHRDEARNRDARFSASGPHQSLVSEDSTRDRLNMSPRDDSEGGSYMERQGSASADMLQESNAQSSISELAHLSEGASGSTKDLLDAAEETIEELLNEAQMWERHSLQLKNDLETLQKDCDEKSKSQSELLLELSASQAERESLRQEIEELKLSMEVATAQQSAAGILKSGNVIDAQNELKDEVQFLRESNENLTTQLKKTQDANIELVSILQELEETIEAQKVEISNQVSKDALLDQINAEWERNMSVKEDEIIALSEKLDRALNIQNAGGVGSDAIYFELEKENDFLKGKIQELEQDCSELTEENLDLIYKLKEVSGMDGQDTCVPDSLEISDADDLSGTSASRVKLLERKCADLELKMLIFRSESRELEEKFRKSQAELEERNLELSELREKLCSFRTMELEGGEVGTGKDCQLKSDELGDTESELNLLKCRVQLKEKEIEDLQHSRLEMETFIDSHVSTNKVLEKKISELESCKVDLGLHISKLENMNIELSDSISGLEAQLTDLNSEKESRVKQIDDSRALITGLKDKIESQQEEMELQKLELKKKQQEFQKRLSEVQDDAEALRRLNAKLQATVDSLVEECNSLQTLTTDLKKQKLELHSCATQLEQELEHSKRKITDFCKTVEFLEAKLTSIQKDISSKEQSFLLELDNIFQDHKEHEDRINHAHFLLNKIEKEKIAEVANLETEIMSLTAQVSSSHEGQESVALDTIREASVLRADKAKLEANLQGVNEQLRHYESQLEDIRKESKSKIKSLADSLNASKQNEEILKTDVEDMRRLVEAAKSNEETVRKTSCELELKFKSSDYEKQQIIDENTGLKFQVQKIAGLQVELLKLQSSLDEAKFEKGKLEEKLKLVSEECEELKVQKGMLSDKVSNRKDTLNDIDEERRSKTSIQPKNDNSVEKGNNDLATDNGGCSPVNEEQDMQTKIQLLESKLAQALQENSMYKSQMKSPLPEEKPGSTEGKENNDDKIAQLESELKDMQDRLLNVSMQYAEVEAQREELVMELRNANTKKGRWF
ncbi:hypothetical protein EJB05_23484 [Eragrostis curvula]|uniref:C2 NT-type domain-containing protein n=1 Tax=Eragrostis curvula TaxID=38414 RepID=A0A5J9V737_9POAL|nr:hypothetical protein EJB05_23484 [Eragrostis curvula]